MANDTDADVGEKQKSTSTRSCDDTGPGQYKRGAIKIGHAATPNWQGKVGVLANDEVRQPTHVREASTESDGPCVHQTQLL